MGSLSNLIILCLLRLICFNSFLQPNWVAKTLTSNLFYYGLVYSIYIFFCNAKHYHLNNSTNENLL